MPAHESSHKEAKEAAVNAPGVGGLVHAAAGTVAIAPPRMLKWSVFIASVLTLSWFFAGWRQVNESGGLLDWALLLFGTASTALLVMVQGFWVYVEEKGKGRLVKKIDLFEKIESAAAGQATVRRHAAPEAAGSASRCGECGPGGAGCGTRESAFPVEVGIQRREGNL